MSCGIAVPQSSEGHRATAQRGPECVQSMHWRALHEVLQSAHDHLRGPEPVAQAAVLANQLAGVSGDSQARRPAGSGERSTSRLFEEVQQSLKAEPAKRQLRAKPVSRRANVRLDRCHMPMATSSSGLPASLL